MSSTKTWDWWRGEVDWSTPAGRLLRRFFDGLPTDRRFHFILFGSAPLQLTLNRSWTSAGVDFFSDDDEDHHERIRLLGLGKGQADLYLEPGYRLSFRTTPLMAERAKLVSLGHVTLTIPHPLDILIAKLARLDDNPATLVAVARACAVPSRMPMAFLGILESGGRLEARVRRLVERLLPRSARLGWVGWVTVLMAGALFLPMGFARRVETAAPAAPAAKAPTDPKTLPASGSTASLKPTPTAPAELNSAPQSQPAAPASPRALDGSAVPAIGAPLQVDIQGRFVEIRGSLPPEWVGLLYSNRSAVRLTAARTRDLTKVLEGLDGTDILNAPRVTTHVNFEAQISVLEDRAVIDGKVLQSLVSPSTDPDPSTVRKVSVGPTLRIMAKMSPASSNLIELVADASIVQTLGYEPDSKGISQPQIFTNRASGRERIWDGQSVLMDAGSVTNRVRFVDKTVYLGDLPLIGRFFRKEGVQDQVSRLFVLVTPTLVDAVGRPIHDLAHPPFDPATFPPNP